MLTSMSKQCAYKVTRNKPYAGHSTNDDFADGWKKIRVTTEIYVYMCVCVGRVVTVMETCLNIVNF